MQKLEELRQEFEERGLDQETSFRLARLAFHLGGKLQLEDWELQKWKELNVLSEDGKLLLSEGEDIESLVFWILLALCWKGLIRRVWSPSE